MIHSLSGGIISEYDNLIYVFVEVAHTKAWYISPFPQIKAGDGVLVPCGGSSLKGQVLRVENVTAQTAPWPVKRTKEVEAIL